MAMAQVYLPAEITNDDHLPTFPKAPPPSPEMQPRNHNHVFEIPASKFEGIGLDLRRDTFPLDEDDESPLTSYHLGAPGYVDKRHSAPIFTRELDEEDANSFPGSPQKRVCCYSDTLPVDLTTTAFPSSNHSSVVSSGFGSYGSYQNTLHSTIPEEGGVACDTTSGVANHSGAHSQSNSPTYFGSRTSPEAGSNLAARRGGASLLATPILQPPIVPEHQSRSFDFHSMHPHLPHSFETTQLPEVCRTRSRTLDGTSSPSHDIRRPRSHTLDANYGEEPVERKRKVSIKRKNPDDTDGSDPSLQFSFEYSYSSTGSGTDTDWVMVDCKVEPTRPMEKKACCASDSLSMAITSRHELGNASLLNTSPLQGVAFSAFGDGQGERESQFMPSLLQQSSVNASPFTLTGQQGVGMATPTEQPISLQSMESMDCEGRLDSLDQMECDQLLPDNPISQASLYQPIEQMTTDYGDIVMRSHPQHRTGAMPLPLRRSCVEEYLQPSHNHRVQGFSDGVMTDPDYLSKSL